MTRENAQQALRTYAEREFLEALIHAVVTNKNPLVSETAAWFRCEWIQDPWTRDVAQAVLDTCSSGGPVSARTLALAMSGKCKLHGESLTKLAELVHTSYGAAHLRYYARQVYDEYRRVAVAFEASSASDSLIQGGDIDETLEDLEKIPDKFAALSRRVVDNDEAIQEIITDMEHGEKKRIHTGLPSLDHVTGGFGPGHLVVVGASTSNGKSSFLAHVAIQSAYHDNRPALFFAVEMTEKELYRRWACWVARLCPRGDNGRKEFLGGLSEVQQLVSKRQLLQVFAGGRNISQIESEVRAYKGELGLVCVDYIQLVRPSDPREHRERQVADITSRLKLMAVECKIPVIAAAQLNRAAGEAPKMHHLRESGSIEQDSDVVLILDPDRGDTSEWMAVDVIVAKNRHGGTGIVTMKWNRPTYRYRDSDVHDKPNYEPAFE